MSGTAITMGEGGVHRVSGTAITMGEGGVHRVSGTAINIEKEGSIGWVVLGEGGEWYRHHHGGGRGL